MPPVYNIERTGLIAFIESVKKYLSWRYEDPMDISLEPMLDLFFAQHSIHLSEKIGPNTKFIRPIDLLVFYVKDIPKSLLDSYRSGRISGNHLMSELVMRVSE